jgi:hypothetical protein
VNQANGTRQSGRAMGNHRLSRNAALAIIPLAIFLSGMPVRALAGERNWSVDLNDYMGMEANSTAGRSHRPIISLAATNSVVAVALGIPDSPAIGDNWATLYSGPWIVTLLLFDANNGKLKKKSGPWSGDPSFELHPTGQGNFLLLLRHLQRESQDPGETLLLLSSSGEELKKLDLPESKSTSRRGWSEFLVSPGGHMLLLGQIRDGNVHYRALEADTLEVKFEWTRDAGSDSPGIVALSDKELLGFRDSHSPEKPRGSDPEREVFVRSFDGPWHPLNTTLDVSNRGGTGQGLHPTQLAFLSDTVLVGVHPSSKERDGSIVEIQSDGTVLSRPVIPVLPDRTTLTGPVAVSAGGRYFAVGFDHQPWISHLLLDVMTMDITFWPDESLFLVWETSNPEPVARIPVGSELRAFSFAPDDRPALAYITGSKLQMIRIQPKSNNSRSQ